MDVWATVQLNADCTLSFTVSSNQPVGQAILWLKKWNNSQESFSRQVRLKVQAQDLRSTAVGHLQHTYTAVVEQEENTSLIYTFAAKLTQCKAVLWMWPVLPDWIFTHSISLTHWERGVTSYGQATASNTGLGCAINRRSLRPAWVCVSVCAYVCVCGSRTKSFLLIRPRTGMEMAPSLRVLGMLRALFNIGAATPYPPPPKKRKPKKKHPQQETAISHRHAKTAVSSRHQGSRWKESLPVVRALPRFILSLPLSGRFPASSSSPLLLPLFCGLQNWPPP